MDEVQRVSTHPDRRTAADVFASVRPDPQQVFDKRRKVWTACDVCGFRPMATNEANRQDLRWWDRIKGWRVGALCRACWNRHCDDRPIVGDPAKR